MSRWIEDAPDLELAGVAHTRAEALELVRELQPDVAALDHGIPYIEPDELVAAFRDAAPAVAIALVSGMPPDALARKAAAVRAESFAVKTSRADDVLAAIRAAAAKRAA
jgi:DNA-binding NarL/FixJ family response regulator